MIPFRLSRNPTTFLLLGLMLFAAGCHRSTQSGAAQQPTARQLQQQQAHALMKKEAAARTELAEIPPPSKHLYVNVHSTEAWQNPFLTVRHDTLTLRIIFPQQTSSALDAGTLLHPAAARQAAVGDSHVRPARGAICDS